jgi:hypothetical protein
MPLLPIALPNTLGAEIDTSATDISMAILRALQYFLSDLKISVQTAIGVPASSAGGVNIDPPVPDTEYDIYLLTAQDTTNTDASDFVVLNYQDALSNQNIQLGRGKFSDFAGNLFSWPATIAGSASPRITPLATNPITIRRKTANDPWFRLIPQINTTSVVGTRNFQVIIAYRPRQRLNP